MLMNCKHSHRTYVQKVITSAYNVDNQYLIYADVSVK
jgi:hypothetical protein